MVQAQRASWLTVSIRLPDGLLSAIADLLNNLHGRKRFVGGIGRTAILTAFAGRAGVRIENVFPGQVGYGCRTKAFNPFVFHVNGGDGAFGLQRCQKGVGAGREDMAKFAVGNDTEKAEHQEKMQPPSAPCA